MGDFATVSHLLRSKMCGEEFDVKVLLPFSYTITEGAQLRYPTLYLLDPEPCLLPLLATSARAQHYYSIAEDGEKRAAFPEYIIVGIGYPRRPEEDSHTYWLRVKELRRRDLTPTLDRSITGEGGSGECPFFAECLAHEVIPMLESTYRSDPFRRAFFGHSLSALFGVWELQHMSYFSAYVLGSPSLWWDDGVVLREVKGRSEIENGSANGHVAKAKGGAAKLVLVIVGGEEKEQTTSQAKELAEALRGSYSKQAVSYMELEGEDHITMKPAFVSRALTWLSKVL